MDDDNAQSFAPDFFGGDVAPSIAPEPVNDQTFPQDRSNPVASAIGDLNQEAVRRVAAGEDSATVEADLLGKVNKLPKTKAETPKNEASFDPSFFGMPAARPSEVDSTYPQIENWAGDVESSPMATHRNIGPDVYQAGSQIQGVGDYLENLGVEAKEKLRTAAGGLMQGIGEIPQMGRDIAAKFNTLGAFAQGGVPIDAAANAVVNAQGAPADNAVQQIGQQQAAKGQQASELAAGHLVPAPTQDTGAAEQAAYYGQQALVGAPLMAGAMAAGPVGGAALFGASMAGESYAAKRAEGERPLSAAASSAIQGSVSALTASLSLESALNPGAIGALRRIAETTGSVEAQSVINEATAIAAEQTIDGKDISADDIKQRLLSAAKGGIPAGLVMGGVGAYAAHDPAVAAAANDQRLAEQVAPTPARQTLAERVEQNASAEANDLIAQGQKLQEEISHAGEVPQDQGGVPRQGAVEEGGGESSGENLQQPAQAGAGSGNAQEGLNEPKLSIGPDKYEGLGALQERLSTGDKPFIDSDTEAGVTQYYAKGFAGSDSKWKIPLTLTAEETKAAQRIENEMQLADTPEEKEAGRQQLSELLTPAAHRVAAEAQAGEVQAPAQSEAPSAPEVALAARHEAPGVDTTLYSMSAYHGSPHDFDEFSTSRIGTGEGAQAYGHGLYFAGNKAVADYYKNMDHPAIGSDPRDDVTSLRQNWQYAGKKEMTPEIAASLMSDYASLQRLAKDSDVTRLIARYVNGHEPGGTISPEAMFALRALDRRLPPRPTGRGYEVELAPDEHEFLDWDKPLGEQSSHVKAALGDKLSQPGKELLDLSPLGVDDHGQIHSFEAHDDGSASISFDTPSGERTVRVPEDKARAASDLMDRQIEVFGDDNAQSGAQLYRSLVNEHGSQAKASEALHDMGVRGIRYRDAGSRSAEAGKTHNYVIFNDRDVKILNKYARGQHETDNLTRDQARSALAQEFGQTALRKLEANGLNLVSRSEIAPETQGLTDAQRAGVKGFTPPNKSSANIVHDNVTKAELAETVVHEVVHANLDRILNPTQRNNLANAIIQRGKTSAKVKAALDKIPRTTPKANIKEEVLAQTMGDLYHLPIGQKVLAQFKLGLNRMGVPLNWINAHEAAIRQIGIDNLRHFAEAPRREHDGKTTFQIAPQPTTQQQNEAPEAAALPKVKPRIRVPVEYLQPKAEEPAHATQEGGAAGGRGVRDGDQGAGPGAVRETVEPPAQPVRRDADAQAAGRPPSGGRDAAGVVPDATGEAVGTKNAMQEAAQRARGLEPVVADMRPNDKTVWDAALQKRADDPTIGYRLAAKYARGTPSGAQEGITRENEAILIQHSAELHNRYDEVLQRVEDAQKSGTTADQVNAQLDRAAVENDLATSEKATREIGRDWSDIGRMRQKLAERDFSMARQVLRFKAITGKDELPQALRDQIDAHVKTIAAKEKELAAKQAEIDALKSGGVEAEAKTRKPRTPAEKKTLDQEFSSLADELRKLTGKQTATLFARVEDAKMAAILRKMARNRSDAGETDPVKIVDAIHAEVGEDAGIAKQDIADTISNYGAKREPIKDELQTRYNAIKRELADLSRTQDTLTGAINPAEAKDRARQTALKTEIEALDRRINYRDAMAPEKVKPEYSEATRKLKEERDAKKQELNNLRPAPAATLPKDIHAQRSENRVKTLQKQLADIKSRIQRKDFSAPPKRVPPKYNDAVQQLQTIIAREKNALNALAAKHERMNDTFVGKALRTIIDAKIFNILASIGVYGKLAAAVVTRNISQVGEEALGTVLAKLPGLSKIAAQSPRYGGRGFWATLGQQAKGVGGAFARAKEDFQQGQNKWDMLYGHKNVSQEFTDFSGRIGDAIKTPGAVNKAQEITHALARTVGSTHAVIKEFVSEPEMNAARLQIGRYEREQMGKKGATPDEIEDYMARESTRASIDARAYEHALESKFQGRNFITDNINSILSRMERMGGIPGKLIAFSAKQEYPVRGIPMNIAKELLTSYPFGFFKALPKIMKFGKMADAEKPAAADYIMKNLRKQGVGIAAIALGGYLESQLGGVPSAEKKKPKVKPGEAELMGQNLGMETMHGPLPELLQLGASMARVYRNEYGADGYTAMLESLAQVYPTLALQTIPYTDQPRRQINTYESAKKYEHRPGIDRIAGDMLRANLVPSFVQQYARGQEPFTGLPGADTFQGFRNPRNISEDIKLGVPGLREEVPQQHSKRP